MSFSGLLTHYRRLEHLNSEIENSNMKDQQKAKQLHFEEVICAFFSHTYAGLVSCLSLIHFGFVTLSIGFTSVPVTTCPTSPSESPFLYTKSQAVWQQTLENANKRFLRKWRVREFYTALRTSAESLRSNITGELDDAIQGIPAERSRGKRLHIWWGQWRHLSIQRRFCVRAFSHECMHVRAKRKISQQRHVSSYQDK